MATDACSENRPFVASIHMNSLESYCSLFKHAVKGTHIHVSAKHSWKYVSEFSYRRKIALSDV
jgi:hypothetical protein